MRLVAVILPDLGTGPATPIIVSYWYAARGETVWEGDRLVEVLVGPATFDVPAPATGRLAEIRVREDDTRRSRGPAGQIAEIEEDGDGETGGRIGVQAAATMAATRGRAPAVRSSPHMTTIHERSAGVIPFRGEGDRGSCTWSSTRRPSGTRAPSGSFPKGAWSRARRARQTAAREFQEETGLRGLVVRRRIRAEPFLHLHPPRPQGRQDRHLLPRRGRRVRPPTRSEEHVEDPHGNWFHWGTFEEINQLLYHTKIRQVFAEADAWLRK